MHMEAPLNFDGRRGLRRGLRRGTGELLGPAAASNLFICPAKTAGDAPRGRDGVLFWAVAVNGPDICPHDQLSMAASPHITGS